MGSSCSNVFVSNKVSVVQTAKPHPYHPIIILPGATTTNTDVDQQLSSPLPPPVFLRLVHLEHMEEADAAISFYGSDDGCYNDDDDNTTTFGSENCLAFNQRVVVDDGTDDGFNHSPGVWFLQYGSEGKSDKNDMMNESTLCALRNMATYTSSMSVGEVN
eukprot:PhF_6_TR35738/c0_g1_i1/m.51897